MSEPMIFNAGDEIGVYCSFEGVTVEIESTIHMLVATDDVFCLTANNIVVTIVHPRYSKKGGNIEITRENTDETVILKKIKKRC